MREVTDAELQRVWTSLRERGVYDNGSTHAELVRLSGGTVVHRMGVGWFVPDEVHLFPADICCN